MFAVKSKKIEPRVTPFLQLQVFLASCVQRLERGRAHLSPEKIGTCALLTCQSYTFTFICSLLSCDQSLGQPGYLNFH